MKRIFGLLALAALLLWSAVPVPAQSNFFLVGGRSGPGIRIASLPCSITTSGYYYLTGNLSYAGGTAITVTANDVTIDLMGFVLTGSTSYDGISFGASNNVEVRNGTITGWSYAVYGWGTNQRAIGVRAVGDTRGIILGSNSLIKGCSASQGSTAGYYALGVTSGTISGCTVYNFTASTSSGGSVYIGSGGGTASDNVVLNCTGAKGIRTAGPTTISHNAVLNCATGISNEGGGSLVGNVVEAVSGQTGIAPATGGTDPNFIPSLLDQNSVTGGGTHYGAGNSATFGGLNGP